ncbi:gamma-tubulin complex component 6 isoform X1 [Ochotona princeps]|uniref:gamma-tubulin complex component 6 isoform X1 n=1 Tax=Ochotona princeps TaxID=9978 RepID=UPI002714D9FB|nr:gamma-tubulin complex component 6 isoform X1 [Ochotona princeps]
MASITQLLDELCEAALPPARSGVSRARAKRRLKRAAYGALLAGLFRDEARPLPAPAALPARNRLLMLSFELRVGGLGARADRLEELLARLGPAAEGHGALDLLVRLAGSGPPQALPAARGGWALGEPAGRRLPHAGYACCALSAAERDAWALLAGEERVCRSMVQEMLRTMEAAPGTGLRTAGPGAFGDAAGDRLHRDARDMDVRLDLPPVPDSADLSGLAIKVPPSLDPWEDEGFQSASNLTPDSQSEPSVSPDVDLWEAALTYEPSRRRCWERIGWPPGHQEEPYLTEAGRDAFDRFCRLRQGALQVLSGGLPHAPSPVQVEEPELVKDVLNILIGVVSATFSLCQLTQAFVVRRGIHVSGASPESVSSLLSEVAEYGTYYMRLSHFSLQPVSDSLYSKGLVFQAFSSGLRRYLQYYRACALSTPPTLSLLTIGFLFKKLGRQLRYLAELCGVGTALPGTNGGGPRAAFPTGVKLLSYLYQEALDNCSNEHYPVLLSLLKTSCEPYTRFIHDWVYSGVFRDFYGEFMIQVNQDYLGCRDKLYWSHGYVLLSREVEECVPVFLRHIAHDVYVCGKTVNLLRLCCPQHYLCWSSIPVPRISVIFSLEELKEIEKDCAVYVGRMERVARHSSISKEEKELRMEIARQELIVHAREAASRVLSELSDQQLSEQKALDAQKREQFQKLKEQFEREQERRLAARQEELDDDFSYARELRDREKRLRALEEEQERKARQALEDRYSRLSAEAARREQKALWRTQRQRLGEARLRFLLEDERHIQALLDTVSETCTSPVPPGVDPPHSQVTSTGCEHPPSPSCDSGPSSASLSLGQCVPMLLPVQAPEVGAETSAGLSLGDFLPSSSEGQQPSHTVVAPLLEEALQTVSSTMLSQVSGETPALARIQTCLTRSDASIRVGENVSDVAPARPRWSVHGHVSDASIRVGENISDVAPARPRWSVHGHMSDASIRVGENISDVAPARPRWSVHGHVSDASIRVGENVSDVAPARPRWNVHGHVSDASIRVGENISDVAPARPRWSVHGHVSDASIRVGENVSDVAPARPRWNVHGHVSDASIRLGEDVSDVAPTRPRWSVHGQPPQLHLMLGGPSPETKASTPSPSPPALQSDLSLDGELHSCEGALPAVCPLGPGSGESTTAGLDAPQDGDFGEAPGQGPRRGDTEDTSPPLPLNSQESSAAQSSPGLVEAEAEAEAEARRRDWEQAYLAGLASQYHPEHYPDNYEAMSEAPAAHLIRQLRPRASAFPVDPQVQSATDEAAVQLSELLTLPVLMNRSLSAPLAAHISLVNKAVVDYFFVELQLEAHFEALRHFLLMEDGEFAQSLSDLLFEKLGAGQSPGELLSPLFLHTVLSKALQCSLHGDSPLAANLSFALKHLPEAFAPNAPDVLSCLELRYKVDWPLNIVITDGCLSRYGAIFSFLLQLKLMMWTLKDICFHLKRTALLSHMAHSVQFRQLQLFKHEMQHFVKVTQGYIANQILHVTWCEFRARLATVGDLEEIQRAHAEYLHKAVFRGLLTEKAAPVMNIIHSVFSLVRKFRSQLISQPWGPAGGPRGSEHPNFALMQQSYHAFKYYSHFLFKVVTKLVNRGYQPHLEDFLLRINFNHYYQDA